MTAAFPPLSTPALEVVRVPCLSDNYVWLLREPTTGAAGGRDNRKSRVPTCGYLGIVRLQCYVQQRAAPLCCLVTSSSKTTCCCPYLLPLPPFLPNAPGTTAVVDPAEARPVQQELDSRWGWVVVMGRQVLEVQVC